MLVLNVLKSSWFQNKALKFYSAVLNRNICYCKFSNKSNVDGKLLKLVSTLGCGIGIAVFFGISNFRFRQRKGISETINYNYSHCEALFDSGDRGNPESPRNKFNFLADVVKKTQNSVVYIEINAR